MLYYVVEMQTTNGVGAVGFTQAYTSEQNAYEKYHDILRIAEKSSVDYHAVIIIDEDLTLVESELAKRTLYPEETSVWFVLEVQTTEGSGAVIPMAYANKSDAWQKYYKILQYAAKSAVEKHGAFMIGHDLLEFHNELAERETVEE